LNSKDLFSDGPLLRSHKVLGLVLIRPTPYQNERCHAFGPSSSLKKKKKKKKTKKKKKKRRKKFQKKRKKEEAI
jgi:hypothetical protein